MKHSRPVLGPYLMILFFLLFALRMAVCNAAEAYPAPPLRVQLMWYHQSQFAGYYVAEFENYFREEGVGVELLEGGADIDPLERLQRGEVDVAVSWLDNAIDANARGFHLVNVAQIFSGGGQELICRVSAGIHSLKDVAGKPIGITWPGDRVNIEAMLRAAGADASRINWVHRSEHGQELVDGTASCISGMSYNEALWVVDAGVPTHDLITFAPKDYGLPHIEDGLYVRAESLKSAQFRENLVKFLRAAKRGWAYAAAQPAPATNIVLHYSNKNPMGFAYQKAMLESLIRMLPKTPDMFGVISIRAYDQTVRALATAHASEFLTNPIWTLSLVEELKVGEHGGGVLKGATLQYLRIIADSEWFQVLVIVGVWVFGFAGALWATEVGYNLVGRAVIGFVGCMGGGVMRDLLLGGERLPFSWLVDPLMPMGVLCAVIIASLLAAMLPAGTHSRIFQLAKTVAEDMGCASLATFGAVVPLSLGLPWVWAPFCAWLTCCGGGLVRDVITGQGSISFRTKLRDECTLIGGCWLVSCLIVSNYFEHTRWLVLVSLGTTIVLVCGLRVFWRKNEVWYPRWLHDRK